MIYFPNTDFNNLENTVWKKIQGQLSSFPEGKNLEMHQSLVSICDSSNCQRCLVNFNHCHNCKGYRAAPTQINYNCVIQK